MLSSINSRKTILNPFRYHFFRIYIYHPFLFILNIFRHPLMSIKLLTKVSTNNIFSLYDLRIKSPRKIDDYFFANLNSKFNSFMMEKYEEDEKTLIEKYLSDDDIVLELGGCIGVVSNIINKKIRNKNNHLVLEIDRHKYKYLEFNKDLNKSGYTIVNGVLSNKKDLYYLSSNNFLGGKLVNVITDVPIKSFTLQELKDNHKLKYNTLVMDIEGGEVEVFKENDLSSFNKLIFEIHFKRNDCRYIEIEKKLNFNNFVKIEELGNVEYWCK